MAKSIFRFSSVDFVKFVVLVLTIHTLFLTKNVFSQLPQKVQADENLKMENKILTVNGMGEAVPEMRSLHLEAEAEREYYALSPPKLLHLTELEQEVYLTLFNCNKSRLFGLEWPEHLRNEIDTYLLDYEEGALLSAESIAVPLNKKTKASEIASNPLMAYRMIRRFVYHIAYLYTDKDFQALSCKWCRKLRSLLADVKLPTVSDERDAIESIHRIQTYHNFSSSDMAKGIFGPMKTRGKLSTVHIVEIGLFALIEKHFVLAIEWLEFGRSTIINKRAVSKNYRVEDIDEYIKNAKKQHDEVWEDLRYADAESRQTLYETKFSDSTQGYRNTVTGTGRRKLSDSARTTKSINDYLKKKELDTMRYKGLCSGKNYQSAEEKRELHCWYERDIHLYWKINPLKMELLHPEPRLVQVYDLFGDDFIGKILAETISTLKPAKIATLSDNKFMLEVSSARTAVNQWIYHRSSRHIKAFYKKLEFFTGLKVKENHESEPLQVAAYSFGGQYSLHTDCVSQGQLKEELGERIATFMTYLNDVNAGGLTAFPLLGTASLPVKGSAVFWYNSFKNGICDQRLVHGACPVIVGTKYVSNIWIRSHSNFLSRACDLDYIR